MAIPLQALLLLLLSSAVFAQVPDNAAPLRAGDPAPGIDWTPVLRSPASAKYSPSLTGQYTVLQFLPVTPNTQAVGRWNEMIAKFTDQPVQFVRKAELARRMGIHKQQVDRLLDIDHASRIEQLEAAFSALQMRLIIAVQHADQAA
jgi:hypothetical protein